MKTAGCGRVSDQQVRAAEDPDYGIRRPRRRRVGGGAGALRVHVPRGRPRPREDAPRVVEGVHGTARLGRPTLRSRHRVCHHTPRSAHTTLPLQVDGLASLGIAVEKSLEVTEASDLDEAAVTAEVYPAAAEALTAAPKKAAAPPEAAPPPAVVEPARPSLAVLLDHGLREFLELGSLLLLGCAIAATIQTLIPRDLFLTVGQAPTLSVISLMVLAVVVSVCSSVDAFLALGFAALVTPGALLAFLLLGPVIDLKSLSLFARLFRRRGILLMLAGVVLAVLLIGQWLNLLLL